VIRMIYPELLSSAKAFADLYRSLIASELGKLMEVSREIEWIELEPKDIEATVAASDSSFHLVESRSGLFYVIQGAGIAVKGATSKTSRFAELGMVRTAPEGGVRHLVSRADVKKALSILAQSVELSLVDKLVEENRKNIILLDGSLISFVRRPRRAPNVRFWSSARLSNIEEILRERVQGLREAASKALLLFVAKSSALSVAVRSYRSEILYNDMQLLELIGSMEGSRYSRPGFTAPQCADLADFKSLSIDLDDVKNVFGDSKFTITYVRFAPRAPLVQITMPGCKHYSSISEALSITATYSPHGYPIPLEYAHRYSKLSKRDVKSVLSSQGLTMITGREYLGE